MVCHLLNTDGLTVPREHFSETATIMALEGQQQRGDALPSPRSGHISVAEGDSMFMWGGFNEHVSTYENVTSKHANWKWHCANVE